MSNICSINDNSLPYTTFKVGIYSNPSFCRKIKYRTIHCNNVETVFIQVLKGNFFNSTIELALLSNLLKYVY